jgi:AcrR family transcriptional regulator
MVNLAGERGFAQCSVDALVARAGVSRRTFYEHFTGLQECFLAVLDIGAETLSELVRQAYVGQESWLDGIRCALASLLIFFDSEPVLTRLWLVESMTAGTWAIEHRERRLKDFMLAITEPWPLPDSLQLQPLAIEAVFASVRSIVVQHVMSTLDDGSLLQLLGPLMGLIAQPFLDDSQVKLEIARATELSHALLTGEDSGDGASVPRALVKNVLATADIEREPLAGILSGLTVNNPRAHRARGCLSFLDTHPEASNGEIGRGVGIGRRGQISALLARLADQGLILKTSGDPGKRNRWRLSPVGERVAAALRTAIPSPECSHVEPAEVSVQ